MSFNDSDLRKCEDFIIDLAYKAGTIITSKFDVANKAVTQKTYKNDLVTETDAAVERYLISSICDEYPKHRFIGEETTSKANRRLTDEPTWIIDPIDGTMNFVHANPDICISIGLVVRKKPILGVIFNPIRKEMYAARLGGGAYLNGQPIRVSDTTEMAKSLCLTSFGMNLVAEKQVLLTSMVKKVHGIRTVGSIAIHMGYVASGAADSSFYFGCHCYDMAAGAIIIQEAGGVVIDTTGADFDVMSGKYLCTSSKSLADEMVRYLSAYNFPVKGD